MPLADWIAHRAEWSPEAVAIRFEDEEISYATLERRVCGWATALAEEHRIRAGDRVAYLGLNRPLVLELLFACARLGAIFVPLNWRLAPAEQRQVIAHASPAVTLVEPELRAALESEPSVTLGSESPYVRTGEAASHAGFRVADDDTPVLLVYTSGTTGGPKGVLLTQEALFWNALNSVAAHDLTRTDHVLSVLPMFHVGGLNIHTTPALYAGARVTLHSRFDPGRTLAAIAAERPTLFLAVPPVSLAMIHHPDWDSTDLSSLRLVAMGSSVVPEAAIRPWLARGVPVTQVYGLSESAPVAICLRREDAERKVGSCGKPAIHCRARVVDDAGRDVAAGERGEIWLRGPNLFREYWNDPATTAAAFTDGWFHTGDVGHRDGEGFFWIDDRKKDVVISGGEKIYPAEIENVLLDCEAIAEAAVVAGNDLRWGEVPVAFVVARPGSGLTIECVRELFEGRLARYKHPREILLVDALPRNAMGKVQKEELRARLANRGQT